ncbi:MAG: chorismate lyase [Candidimonas sp.]|nr:MAG: chorismate lyase [Candidimonas sp.]TAM24735.1 MAG: chorismate lyase [Candidimonas sp.]TAM80009.1 MAG: chorismate lyase [Candidimonas sp.]
MKLHPADRSGWQSTAAPSFTHIQKHWLSRPDALTAGLRQIGQVRLLVVREQADSLTTAEAWLLQLPPKSPIWMREIMMSIDGVASVVARSFTPLVASHGWWQGMRRLRARPLADMLYGNPQITRSAFFSRRLDSQQPFYATIKRSFSHQAPPAKMLLARCSVFWRARQPLVVAECFLPAFWPLASKMAYDPTIPSCYPSHARRLKGLHDREHLPL